MLLILLCIFSVVWSHRFASQYPFLTHPPKWHFLLKDENKTTVSIIIPGFLIQRSIMPITDIKCV